MGSRGKIEYTESVEKCIKYIINENERLGLRWQYKSKAYKDLINYACLKYHVKAKNIKKIIDVTGIKRIRLYK